MKLLAAKYKQCFSDRYFVTSSSIAICVLILSLFINFFAGTYANERASSPVTDLILSNIRVYNVGGLFVYGSLILCAFIAALCLAKPERIPFVAKSITMFVLIRSAFIVLTHIGPFPTHTVINPGSIINEFTFGGDLFFSGHTGLPFLMALIFWDHDYLREIFLILSVVFGAVVLMTHLHYSIDVLAAFFITYSIHHINQTFFKKDFEIFQNGLRRNELK